LETKGRKRKRRWIGQRPWIPFGDGAPGVGDGGIGRLFRNGMKIQMGMY